MQRWCTKLRFLSLLPTTTTTTTTTRASLSSPSLNRFCYSACIDFQHPSTLSAISSHLRPHFNASTNSLVLLRNGFVFSRFSSPYMQVRSFSAISKEKKWKKLTPATSKVKKIKIKGYSSYKGRFKTLHDGTIRRWRAGKRHNAHSKSKKAKRRLRRPEIVPLAYAKVMKKLNFCG